MIGSHCVRTGYENGHINSLGTAVGKSIGGGVDTGRSGIVVCGGSLPFSRVMQPGVLEKEIF